MISVDLPPLLNALRATTLIGPHTGFSDYQYGYLPYANNATPKQSNNTAGLIDTRPQELKLSCDKDV
jgi:hypothetical protein